jgi:hypothetical protein
LILFFVCFYMQTLDFPNFTLILARRNGIRGIFFTPRLCLY